jgi:hypothetical protein
LRPYGFNSLAHFDFPSGAIVIWPSINAPGLARDNEGFDALAPV